MHYWRFAALVRVRGRSWGVQVVGIISQCLCLYVLIERFTENQLKQFWATMETLHHAAKMQQLGDKITLGGHVYLKSKCCYHQSCVSVCFAKGLSSWRNPDAYCLISTNKKKPNTLKNTECIKVKNAREVYYRQLLQSSGVVLLLLHAL